MLFVNYPFDSRLLRNIQDAGYRRPTDIQFRAIPPILQGNDLLAVAHTGTGKTLAFTLPVLQLLTQLKKTPRKAISVPTPAALILVPTHELAQQIGGVVRSMARGLRLPVAIIIGGEAVAQQAEKIPLSTAVVVATPGRAHDLARNQVLTFEGVQYLIFDEADKMLSLGFQPDIERMLQFMPSTRQTLFFSATISKEVKKLAYRLVSNPIRIEIAPENPVAKGIQHGLLEVPMEDKRFFLERLLRGRAEEKVLVFVRTKVRAVRVQRAMQRVQIPTLLLHGSLDREQRQAALEQFAQGKDKVLISTDISARGLDIPHVAVVVNYDMPLTPEVYVHRIGRTGRAKAKGESISFCAPQEEPLRQSIEEFLGYLLPVVELEAEQRASTIQLSREVHTDWRTLIKRENERQEQMKLKKKRKKK